MNFNELLVGLIPICIILLVTVVYLVYRNYCYRRESKVCYEKLQSRYDRLYQENQFLNERLENSISYFKQTKQEIFSLSAVREELEEKNKELEEKKTLLQEQLKAESDRCRILSNIEITAEFIEAKRLIYETSAPFIFISGGAGTGKSFFINNLLDRSSGDIAFVAPTGLAARNIGGRTIHSFFGFSIKTPFACAHSISREQYLNENYDFLRRLKILVIDEISMVRADILDLICAALMLARNDTRLFGGVKIVAVGDLYQLPPVVDSKKYPELEYVFSSAPKDVMKWKRWQSPWFFDAQCLMDCDISFVEFSKQFRQAADILYAENLNTIRTGFSNDAGAYFNQAVKPAQDKYIPRIFNKKVPAREYNEKMLQTLSGDAVLYEGVVSGIFSEYSENDLPVPLHLELKAGAAVMFVRNSADWRNGTLGFVVSLNPDSVVVKSLDDQKEYTVMKEVWNEYSRDEDGEYFCIGSYVQIPLVLAWAFNVHKMQGLTFDQIVYNPSGWVLPGMIYVALSRTRSLNGLYLEAPLNSSNIQQNGLVREFYNKLRMEKEKSNEALNNSLITTENEKTL